MAESNNSKAAPDRSEKYLLGEKMVVEFLGKPYELGVSSIPPEAKSTRINVLNAEKQHLLRDPKRIHF